MAGNGVSPGHLSDRKGVSCDMGKKDTSWVEWVQIAEVCKSQAARLKSQQCGRAEEIIVSPRNIIICPTQVQQGTRL